MQRCRVCGASFFNIPLLLCDSMPRSAQYLPNEENLDEDCPISYNLVQCTCCGLVQIDATPVGYYKNVVRSGGYSSTMYNLRYEQYRNFMKLCPIEGKKVVEIGCGQGEFLRVWREGGFNVEAYGIENERDLVTLAQEDGLNVTNEFALNEGTVLKNAPFDAFCSFNFLEHQPDPNGMLRCIYNNLREDAWGIITVPSFEYILEKESYYELIRDHLLYFTKESFRFILEKNGFLVKSFRLVNRDTWEAVVEKRKSINSDRLYTNRETLGKEVESLVLSLKQRNMKLAVWGASHQGLTILSSLDFNGLVSYVIDSAPFKQGKYTAGSHIKIVSSDYTIIEPVQAILIIAPGYTDEIASIIEKKCESVVEVYALRGNSIETIRK